LGSAAVVRADNIVARDDLLGMVIFNPTWLEEAQRLLGEDTAVQAGVPLVEYHNWCSSAHVLSW
jgi:hypothetical protein